MPSVRQSKDGLGRPHDVLLAPPPRLAAVSPDLPATSPMVAEFAKRASGDERTLSKVIHQLSRDLRRRHRTKLPYFPTDITLNDIQAYFERILVSPVLQLLSQLRRPLKLPLKYHLHSPHKGLSIITIAEEADSESAEIAKSLGVIFLSTKSLDQCVVEKFDTINLPTTVTDYLYSSWEIQRARVVLCTDLHSLFIFRCSSKSNFIIFEEINLDSALVILRVVIAAYVRALLPNDYIAQPSQWPGNMPSGCVISPDSPLQSDEEVFKTHRRHADFDFHSLTQIESCALQFFRWKEHAQTTPPTPLVSGERLSARTSAFDKQEMSLKPFYEMGELSQDTLQHMLSTLRTDPLHASGIRLSAIFEIEIISDLTPADPPAAERDACVYRCRLVSVDGTIQEATADLCVKLFDDRQALMRLDPQTLAQGFSPVWWTNWTTNEDSVRHEHGAYTRLSFMHGSLLPWYYGAHEFSLPDGRMLYGILMEFIHAPTLDKLGAATLSDEEQIQFIKSTRRIVAALQCADVSQSDWHSAQLLCPRSTKAGLHAVLIDLTRCSTTVDPDVHHGIDDIDLCGQMLTDEEPEYATGLRKNLVDTYFRWREDWDTRVSWRYNDSSQDPFECCYFLE